jgi:acyl-coenzyme A synthetase/AMP-(fatty) acid ligase
VQNLFIGNTPKEKIIFKNAGQDICCEKFISDINALTASLIKEPARRWALCYQDSYLFTVALFAVLNSGGIPILLPNNQPGTLELLQTEFDGVLNERGQVWTTDNQPVVRCPDLTPSIVLFTSGSTGQAKKVVRHLEQLLEEIKVLDLTFGPLVKNSQIYTTVSHQHIYGLLFNILWPLYAGNIINLPPLTSPLSIENIINQPQPITLISSPSLLSRMPEIKIINPHVTIFSSGGKLKDRGQVLTPIDILGSTETSGVAYRRGAEHNWTPLPKVNIQIDETSGCLKVSSPFFNQESFVMGDQATINNDGSFQLLDRADRIAKIEGKRLSLLEMENILHRHQMVNEAYALAIDDHREYVAALIVLNAEGKKQLQNKGKIAINKELTKFLAQYFEPITLPKKFRYVDAIPTNSQGKHVVGNIKKLFE